MIEIMCLRHSGIIAKLISWGTTKKGQSYKKSPSHIAILFFGKFVLHSTWLKGVHISTFKHISQNYEILARYGYTKKVDQDFIFKDAILQTIDFKYDFIGVFFLAIRFFMNRYFGRVLPGLNKWQKKDQLFCVEVANYITGENLSNLSPNDLMYRLNYMKNFKRL